MKTTQHLDTFFHIVLKGHTNTVLFQHSSDYMYFLDILNTKKKQFAFEVLGYCLLKDHVHLVIDSTPKSTLSSIMHGIIILYTKYYQKKYSIEGAVFSGRGLSETFHNSKELICRIRYIHQKGKLKNPEKTLNYPYSSYNAYIHPNEPSIISRYRIYRLFDKNNPQIAANLFSTIHHALEPDTFLDIEENLYEKVSLAKKILKEELSQYKINYQDIQRPTAYREKLILKIYQETGLNQQEVADLLCLSRHIVGRAIRLNKSF